VLQGSMFSDPLFDRFARLHDRLGPCLFRG
jgi:hypothetical protein